MYFSIAGLAGLMNLYGCPNMESTKLCDVTTYCVTSYGTQPSTTLFLRAHMTTQNSSGQGIFKWLKFC